uniref:Chitin-binding protein n=1 Tax=Holotrichia oblita TaxID=644536 RepID=M1EYJ2_HOLOL|nr:chitin-binding protein [Holotrichia oblita]
MKAFLFVSSVLLAVHLGQTDPVGVCPSNNGASDVLLADTDNCAIYYQCDWGKYVVKNCPATLYFNTENSECDYLRNVNCDRSSLLGSDEEGEVEESTEEIEVGEPIGECPNQNPEDEEVLLADSLNCGVFYKCDWGEPVLQECPGDLLFNAVKNVCDWAENVDCDRSNIGEESTEDSSEPESEPLFACPDSDSLYIPDKIDCSKYYVCIYGKPVESTCPEGLHYDGTRWICDYPEKVTCGVYGPQECAGNNGEEPAEPGAGAIGSCPAVNGEVDVLLPDAENCAIFYKCDNGVPVIQDCPDGLLFNANLDVCDWPENVNCDRTIDGGEDSTEVGSNEDNNGSDPDPLFECPESEALYIPDKTDCTKYYVCVYGKPVEFTCPAGLHYDGILWTCNYPDQVTCGVYAPQENGGSDEEVETPAPGAGAIGSCPAVNGLVDVLLPDAENCAIFYKCDNGVPVVQDCPDGLLFNADLDICDWPENVNCDRSSSGGNNSNEDGSISGEVPGTDGDATGPLIECPAEDGLYATYIPDKTDCTKFYVCVHGTPVINSCPEGLYYDGTIWACTYEEYAQCGVYRPIEGDASESEEEGQPGGSENPWVGECPVASEVDVFLPSRDDPHKFYICVGTTPVELECPSNLVFDFELQRCEYA